MLTKKLVLFAMGALVGLGLLGCQTNPKEVEVTRMVTQKETVIETVVEQETIVIQVTPTPQPVVEGPRTLVICQGEEPETLYIYDSQAGQALASKHIQEAIYDGPIDNRSFDFQPVILEKLPSLGEGDAVIETVTMETGDLVVDDADQVVILEPGVVVRPAGCYSSECAVEFTGDPLEMEQMVVTFQLREGLSWSDGEPLTVNDSVYSFELLKDPDTPANRYTTDRTASYEASDDYTVVWIGLPGFRDTTYFTNFWPPLPEHIWGDLTALELVEADESTRMPMGWGPYTITEWVAGDHITLVKNENYWRADEGLPYFDSVIFQFVGQDADANLAALLAGQCDVVDQTAQLDSQGRLLLELEAVGKLNAVFANDTIWEHVDFGIDPAPSYERPDFFQDVRVRRALAYCMDRQRVVEEVMGGQSVVLDTYLSPSHPLYEADVRQYPFDPVAGSELLEEAGWIDDDGDPATPRIAQDVEGVPDGTLLEFSYYVANSPRQQEAAGLLRASMAECGVQANVEIWDRPEYTAPGPEGPIFGRSFDVSHFAWVWVAGVEPPCNLYLSSAIPSEENGWDGANVSGFTDEEYDAACLDALQLLPGQPNYERHHREAQTIFAEQLPVVPLYPWFKLAATNPELRGFEMDITARSEMWNIEEFRYGE